MSLVTQALARKPGEAAGSRGCMEGSPSLLWADARASHRVPTTTKDTRQVPQKASELHSEGKFMVTSGDRRAH